MAGENCTTPTAVSTTVLSSKVYPAVRADSSAPKVGTIRVNYSRNRLREKEFFLLKI